MDTNQWPQGIGLVKPIEASNSTAVLERKPRPQKEQALKCPRCNSTNTKFCYYNNYSLSQPRYFCKTCRRYWTAGGTLRNVPVGGGSRKNKRSTSSLVPASVKKLPDLTKPSFSQSTSQNLKIHEGHDLNLAYPPTGTGDYGTSSMSGLLHFPFIDSKSLYPRPNANSSNLPAIELLKAGISSRGSLSSLMSMPLSDSNSLFYSSVLPLHDLKPKFKFSLDGLENGYGSVLEQVQETSAGLFLPHEELKPLSTVTDQYDQQHKGQGESTGYWNGMLGGGSW